MGPAPCPAPIPPRRSSIAGPESAAWLQPIAAVLDRVDLLIVTVEYQQVALDRSRDGVIAVEDVIVHKLIAWRPRDQDVVLSILRADPHLDAQCIEHWAQEWGVVDRWREALASR